MRVVSLKTAVWSSCSAAVFKSSNSMKCSSHHILKKESPLIMLPFGPPFRCDPDSGHDSGAEESQDSPPFCFLTVGMGKILLPRGAGHSQSQADSHSQTGLHSHSSSQGHAAHVPTAPLPPRLGVCLDCDKGRVAFYDAHSLRLLWEGHLDCSSPVCPAFCFIGGGALQLQDLVANRSIEEVPPRRVTIQTRAKNIAKNVG